jgi:hypothetical protein
MKGLLIDLAGAIIMTAAIVVPFILYFYVV